MKRSTLLASGALAILVPAARAELNNPRSGNTALTVSAMVGSAFQPTLPATNTALVSATPAFQTTRPASCTQVINVNADLSAVMNFYGGLPGGGHNGSVAGFFACSNQGSVAGNCGGFSSNFGFAVDFMTDAPTISIDTTATTCLWNLLVDGQYVVLGAASRTSGGVSYDVAQPAVAGPHRITFESAEGIGIYDIAIPATAKIWKPSVPTAVRIGIVGDSITAGTGTTGPATFRQTWGDTLGRYLGTSDVWLLAAGGTGYLNNATNGLTFRGRIADLAACNPDLLVLAGGINDSASSTAAIKAEVTTYLQAIRAQGGKLATCPIFVLGPFNGSYATAPSAATMASIETAIFAGVAAAGDSRTYTVSTQDAAASGTGAWMTGTGTTSATTGDGNADLYMNPVGGNPGSPHPNNAGHLVYGARAARAIAGLLRVNQP